VLVTDLPRSAPPGDLAPVIEMYRQTVELLNHTSKPVVVMGTTLTDITAFGRDVATQTGYPNVLGGIHHGLVALGRAVRWSEVYRAAQRGAVPAGEPLTVAATVPELTVPEQPGSSWSEHRASALLAAHGVPVVPGTLVTSPEQAAEAAAALGYPVVVKLSADGIEHKSDIGGVKIGLRDAAAVAAAYAEVVAAGRAAGAGNPGALVQPMRSGGIELLVGVVTDPVWGQVLAVGFGGVWVEILRDTALSVLPADRGQILQSLRSLRGARLFDGPRGTEKADLDAVADAIASVAALAQRLGPRLEALEVNPLLVKGSQVEALDALITWRQD
jgi:acyl-CoA synthetase (NDP forming)